MAMRDAIRWKPPAELSRVEERMCRRLTRTGRLYRFLRLHRHRLFDEAFQARMAEIYASDYGPGRPPVPPALLMMVTLLQAYSGISDAEAVHLSLFDKRWQMVLDCFGCEVRDQDGRPPFSQGLLAQFRFRMIEHDLDQELVRRTVALAKETKDFGYKGLRMALDSAPIWGRGRVQDTYNLIGHGLMVCVACAADAEDLRTSEVVEAAGLKFVGKSSVKAALDIDWDDKDAKREALGRLLEDVARFRAWLESRPREEGTAELYTGLDTAMEQLDRLIGQDTEPDPDSGGERIRKGTAKDRQISVEDPEMRHGRKSKSVKFNGYKGHAAYELASEMVLDTIVVPANLSEHEGGDLLRENVEYYGTVEEMNTDRGYLAGAWIADLHAAGVPVYSKPWNPTNKGLFPKSAFRIDLAARQVTCPSGDVADIPDRADQAGRTQVNFEHCSTCTVRAACTESTRGRTVVIHRNEDLLQRLQREKRTPKGRQKLRERVDIEHTLAHLLVYQPHQARYVGARKNTLALRRAAAIVNLQAIDRPAIG